ncbi:hypothetical protein BDZ85DRAFT_286479 [Elsinoe ampelina]|uniref:F-box domain-containing protein n=1 Tax=Elsinoe ampelina TaxID=302913 RepID=A0A6A6FXX7_9PEZI|nr:hypothetical protein BDZ85DRAFT_286479 [Elsinoe ampelina]
MAIAPGVFRNLMERQAIRKRQRPIAGTDTEVTASQTTPDQSKGGVTILQEPGPGVMRSLPTLLTTYGTLATSFSLATSADQGSEFDASRNVYRQVVTIESSIPFEVIPKLVKKQQDKDTHNFTIRMCPTDRNYFRFMDLPAEIRAMVLSHVLARREFIRLDFDRASKKSTMPPRAYIGNDNAMLFVNKFLHNESAGIFYGMNEFRFASTTIFVRFMKMIGKNAGFIGNLKIEYRCLTNGFEAAAALSTCHSLERLHWPLSWSQRHTHEEQVQALYKALWCYFARHANSSGGIEGGMAGISIGSCGPRHAQYAPNLIRPSATDCDACKFRNDLRALALGDFPVQKE